MTVNTNVFDSWSEARYNAANEAARNARRGHDTAVKHEIIERMNREEIDAYITHVDAWLNAYDYCMQSGRLHHPIDNVLLGDWKVTPELQEQFKQLIALTRSILRRAMRHANKLGGQYDVEKSVGE